MNIKRIFLPIGLFYGAITSFRNFFFRVKILKKYQPSVFTLSVGNLQIGGTGKTPHVEYFIDLFKKEEIAILSRGYGRKTTGFLEADEKSTPQTIGDEPFQVYNKYADSANVYVCEDRPKGILEIMKIRKPTVILLDDAFQHQYISPHLNLLLTTYQQPFTQDEMLPVGRLREFKANANRADAIVVTKCPEEVDAAYKNLITNRIREFIDDDKPIFFSRVAYQNTIGYNNQTFDSNNQTILISGIAKPELFEEYANENFSVFKRYRFNDHHQFTSKSIDDIIAVHGKVQYLTTEKDFVKIKNVVPEEFSNLFYYLPIKVSFEKENEFNDFILTSFALYQSS
jgi:tetraacyldisaccharide 4'-kinase